MVRRVVATGRSMNGAEILMRRGAGTRACRADTHVGACSRGENKYPASALTVYAHQPPSAAASVSRRKMDLCHLAFARKSPARAIPAEREALRRPGFRLDRQVSGYYGKRSPVPQTGTNCEACGYFSLSRRRTRA